MGEGRAALRFSDLMELADLVARVSAKPAQVGTGTCKDNYAAPVRQITPQECPDDA